VKAVTFHSAAERELVEALAWYGERSERVADGLLMEVKTAVARLQRWPLSAPVVDRTAAGTEIRQVRLTRFPYGVVYVDLEEELRVVALAHLRRVPGYWASRLIDKT
jgi:hypothetical protein